MLNKAKNRITLATRVLLGKSSHSASASKKQVRQIPAITPDEVAEARTFFPCDKFFIFGHARSGTTMLARTIRLHPDVHCNYQAHFFTRAPLLESLVASDGIEAWLKRRSNRWNHGQDLSPVVLRAVADYILEREARPLGKRIVGDKSPNSLNDGEAVRLMHKVFPDGYLIYIVRDGRDTVLSHRIQAFIDFPDQLSGEDLQIRDQFAQNPEPFLHGNRSIFTEKAIQRAAEGWVRNVTETHSLGKELFSEHYFALRYEDLLQRPWQEMCKIWQFLGASPTPPGVEQTLLAEMDQNPDANWQIEKAQQIALPLQKGRQGSWREIFTARDTQVFQRIAGQTLKDWGYEI